jgi:hypothetical protein
LPGRIGPARKSSLEADPFEASCRSFDDVTSTRVEERTIKFRLVQEGANPATTRTRGGVRRGEREPQKVAAERGIPASVIEFHSESGAQSSSSSSEEAASAGSCADETIFFGLSSTRDVVEIVPFDL